MGENLITMSIRSQLVQLESTMAQGLIAECERGQMSPEQLDWILEFFASLDLYDEAEAAAQLEAWACWRDQTHPGWDPKRVPRTAKEESA